VSDEAAAALANSLLRDIGYLKPDADAVNWQKIRREKTKVCGTIFCATLDKHQSIECIGVDSKRDKGSLAFEEYEENGNKCLRTIRKTVDHISFTIESGK
jgi:hypothetical protein